MNINILACGVNDDFWLWARTTTSWPGRQHGEEAGTPREGVGRVEGQELPVEPEDQGPGGQGHARAVCGDLHRPVVGRAAGCPEGPQQRWHEHLPSDEERDLPGLEVRGGL
eukprot:4596487-Heterocapsa_arctica.AAC.1